MKRSGQQVEEHAARVVRHFMRAVVRRQFALCQQIQRGEPLLPVQDHLLRPGELRRVGSVLGCGRRGGVPEQQAARWISTV